MDWENEKYSRLCSMGMKSGHAPAKLPLQGEGLYSMNKCALWYRGDNRGTLPLTSPCSGTKRKTAVPLFFASTGGLRLPLLSPLYRNRFFLLDFTVLHFAELASSCKLKLSSFTPILHLSLQLIGFYSTSLLLRQNIKKSILDTQK